MRILLDQAVYDMRNKGNVALLQVAVMRFHELWPNASLEVMTAAPHLLKIYCLQTHPVSSDGRHDWSGGHDKLARLHRCVPHWALRSAFEAREEIWRRWPRLTPDNLRRRIAAFRAGNDATANHEEEDGAVGETVTNATASSAEAWHGHLPDVEQALRGADILVVTGGGFMCDSDKERAIDVMSRLEVAIQMGKPTFMVGQGVGPIDDPELAARSRSVLPLVDLILVRESRHAPRLLESLGVPQDRILMTGDDAVELAYDRRPTQLGVDIGVSVRLAHYTAVDSHHLEPVRALLHDQAMNYGAQLVAIPISCDGHEADQQQIARLLRGYPRTSSSWRRFDPPVDVIRTVGRCRVVIAGAFHAAVFALAQGIPVVGLVRSQEYANKFQGIVDQFGSGCQLLNLNDPDWDQQFSAAFEGAWKRAEDLRPELLDRARHQISLNRAGYQRIAGIVREYSSTTVSS